MAAIKLGRLPDRSPVKLTILVTPDLHQALADYAAAYAEAYGETQAIAELVPAMLDAYLQSDRAFAQARKRMRLARVE
jgi:hypothetical protein